MLEGANSRDAPGGVVSEHLLQEIEAVSIELGHDIRQSLSSVAWELWVVRRQLREARPDLLIWCSEDPEDAINLINLRIAFFHTLKKLERTKKTKKKRNVPQVPVNNGRRVASSAKMQPIDQMSTGVE